MDQNIRSDFDRLKAELLRSNSRILPGECHYFHTHQRRFFHDVLTLNRLDVRGPILEVGAYPFFLTALLGQMGHSVVGLDLNPSRSADFIAQYRLNVVACDVERQRLPFADNTFECVLFNEILEHLRIDPLLALSEANRVLKRDGLLLLTTPNLYFIKTVLKFLIGRGFIDPVGEFGKLRRLGHMGHIREYSEREVKRLMDVSGFVVVNHEFKQFNYPVDFFGVIARLILALVPMMRGDQTVVAKKLRDGPNLIPLTA